MKAKLIDFVGRVPLLGAALRRMAQNYPEGSVVTIGSGLAAGYRWKRHHRYVNGYWLGHYELRIQEALRAYLKPGQTIFDVGANAGFFTLVAARLVGPSGRVVAFDPSPANQDSIREQLDLNELTNCTAAPQAVADRSGKAMFSFAGAGSPMGHLGDSSSGEVSIEVEMTTLDAAAARHGNADFVKMDIEGAEVSALQGASSLLKNVRPTWLIELHGPECEAGVRRILLDHGYRFADLESRTLDPAASLPHHLIARPS